MTSIKNLTLVLAMLAFSSAASATEPLYISPDNAMTADELLSQYDQATEEMSAEKQLQHFDELLKSEELDLLQPICIEYEIDLNSGEEICVSP